MSEVTRQLLVIDDEAGMRNMLRMVLERAGYQVCEAETAIKGLEELSRNRFDLVLCDIRMPELDGIGFLQELQQRNLPATVIMMSAYGSLDTAVECLKQGAYDYISKPFKPDEIILTLRKAEERLRLLRENALLKEELGKTGTLDALIYASPAMDSLVAQVRQVAGAMSPVLVTGETGTGKELIARALHFSGPRKDGPFVAVNCSAIAANLLESELFGHSRGRLPALTGREMVCFWPPPVEPSFSMRLVNSRWSFNPSFCGFCRKVRFVGSVKPNPVKLMPGLWSQPPVI